MQNEQTSGIEKKRQEEQLKKNITMYAVVTVCTCLVAAVIFGLAAIACRNQFSVYMKFVFIPFFAFTAGFINTRFLRKCKGAALVALPLCIIFHLIFSAFEWAVFLWLILYFANWLIGVIIAMLVFSYTKGKNK